MFSLEGFVKALLDSTKRYQGDGWTLQKLRNHVKIFSNDYQFHYRLSTEDWSTVKKQFAAQIDNKSLHIR